jgi:hypothetical protein
VKSNVAFWVAAGVKLNATSGLELFNPVVGSTQGVVIDGQAPGFNAVVHAALELVTLTA